MLKQNKTKDSFLPIFVVGMFCLNLSALILLMFHRSILKDLDRQLTPQSLVQLIDGRAITVDPELYLERHPETIRRFVGETINLMLTWSRQQPLKTVWEVSSQLISDDLKPKFKSEIASLDPANQFENINSENILVVETISQPTKIGDGKWKVEIVANQLIFSSSDNLGKSIAFNKQILLRATDKQSISIPDAPLPLHSDVYRIGEARLEIYNICEIVDKNCS
jgi:hypothetical protein